MPIIKPSVSYEWDTNATSTVATTNGHKDDGYVSNEIPASTEINYLWNAYYQWFTWLEDSIDEVEDIKYLNLTPAAGTPTESTQVYTQTAGGVSGTDLKWRVSLPLKSGGRVVEVRCRVKDSSTGPQQIRAVFRSTQDGLEVDSFDSVTSNGSGNAQTLIMTVDVDIDNDRGYEIEFDHVTSTGQTLFLYEISVAGILI